MQAIVVTDEAAGTGGMTLVERAKPSAAINDVIVEVHASGVRRDRDGVALDVDRSRFLDRRPSIPGHELAGVVSALGYGTTGVSVGQRVLGLADWHRDGTLAEYVAIEARNLAPLPGDVDFTVGASLPILTQLARDAGKTIIRVRPYRRNAAGKAASSGCPRAKGNGDCRSHR